jgi:hypothetical protein
VHDPPSNSQPGPPLGHQPLRLGLIAYLPEAIQAVLRRSNNDATFKTLVGRSVA